MLNNKYLIINILFNASALIGSTLMKTLIEACAKQGYHTLIACITEGNGESIALHEKLGFKQASHFHEVGCKFGRWLGVVDYELTL